MGGQEMRDRTRIIAFLKSLLVGDDVEVQGVFTPEKVVVHYRGYVQPKARPRFTKTGRVYTPPETVAFERAVANTMWMAMKGRGVLVGPVRLHLDIYDKYPDKFSDTEIMLAECDLLFPTHGDNDNKQKAIQDAANGILFVDDKQVVRYSVSRTYAEFDGFDLVVEQMPAPLPSEVKAVLR